MPKIHWEITEQDALDMMSLASLIHRRLDHSGQEQALMVGQHVALRLASWQNARFVADLDV